MNNFMLKVMCYHENDYLCKHEDVISNRIPSSVRAVYASLRDLLQCRDASPCPRPAYAYRRRQHLGGGDQQHGALAFSHCLRGMYRASTPSTIQRTTSSKTSGATSRCSTICFDGPSVRWLISKTSLFSTGPLCSESRHHISKAICAWRCSEARDLWGLGT